MENAQDGGCVLPCACPLDHEQRLQAIDFQTRLGEQALAGCALDGSEPNDSVPVVPQQKLHPTVAEQALSIEDNDHIGAFSLTVR